MRRTISSYCCRASLASRILPSTGLPSMCSEKELNVVSSGSGNIYVPARFLSVLFMNVCEMYVFATWSVMSTRTASDFKLNPMEPCPCNTGGRLGGGGVTGRVMGLGGCIGLGTPGTIGGLTTGGISATVATGAPNDGSTTMKPEAFADGAINRDAARVRMDLTVTRFI